MSVLHPPRKRRYYCLMSKLTGNQLGPLQSTPGEITEFIRKTGDQYTTGIVVVCESAYMRNDWHFTEQTTGLHLQRQFLTPEQCNMLLTGTGSAI